MSWSREQPGHGPARSEVEVRAETPQRRANGQPPGGGRHAAHTGRDTGEDGPCANSSFHSPTEAQRGSAMATSSLHSAEASPLNEFMTLQDDEHRSKRRGAQGEMTRPLRPSDQGGES